MILRPKDLMDNKAMPLSRHAQDPRVGYVAIMVCDVLTHLMKAMLKERRASATGREIAKLFAAFKGHEAIIDV